MAENDLDRDRKRIKINALLVHLQVTLFEEIIRNRFVLFNQG